MSLKRTHSLVNLVGLLLASVAIAFGGYAWAEGPPRRPVQLFSVQADGELVPAAPPGPASSASPIFSGEAAFWSGVTAVALVFANGIVGFWMKWLDNASKNRTDALEIRMLRQAAIDKDANIEVVRKALELANADRAERQAQRALPAEGQPS